jgi:ssDNA-binding Zn-finger/Zn-ribbon topoisomerase 1
MSSDDNRPRSDAADLGLCPKCGGGMVLIRRTQYPDTDHEAETLACHKCGELVTRFSTKRGKKAKNRAVPRHTGL